MTDVLTFLGKLPPEAFTAFGRLLTSLLAGDVSKAQREARAVAETIAAKKAMRAAYAAGAKARK